MYAGDRAKLISKQTELSVNFDSNTILHGGIYVQCTVDCDIFMITIIYTVKINSRNLCGIQNTYNILLNLTFGANWPWGVHLGE